MQLKTGIRSAWGCTSFSHSGNCNEHCPDLSFFKGCILLVYEYDMTWIPSCVNAARNRSSPDVWGRNTLYHSSSYCVICSKLTSWRRGDFVACSLPARRDRWVSVFVQLELDETLGGPIASSQHTSIICSNLSPDLLETWWLRGCTEMLIDSQEAERRHLKLKPAKKCKVWLIERFKTAFS